MSDDEKHDPRPEEDTFKILIATDCHLGFLEKTSRGEDSFITFEEILSYAKKYAVDFILLGGDLFHDNKPSQNAILKCLNLLRKYCLGCRSNTFQLLTDPRENFKHCLNKSVNFEDPNLNIEIPVFSIHGNHDDPSGFGQIGSLDVLSVTGMVNYFGKWTNLNEVTIAPLLLKKGNTHLALYGLSYIKDQRLARLLRDKKVNMLRPKEIDDTFNMFVLHQNRAQHSDLSFVPEDGLPKFLDFVLWGHEHECRIAPEPASENKYYICQPGSPVATSLCEGESVRKRVGILHVHKSNFRVEEIKLKTVRPFVFDTLYVHDNENIKLNHLKRISESIEEYVDRYIENVMMPKATDQLSGHPRQPILPLIRLRVVYTQDEEAFDTIRLDQKYFDQIGNPGEMILLRKQRGCTKLGISSIRDETDDIMEGILGYDSAEPEWNRSIQGGIRKYFAAAQNRNLMSVLSVTGLNEALHQFVDKSDGTAFQDVIEHQMKKTREYIDSFGEEIQGDDDILEKLRQLRNERDQKEDEEESQARQVLTDRTRKTRVNSNSDEEEETVIDDSDHSDHTEAPVRGRSRGRGTRGTRTTGRGRASKPASPPTKTTRGAKRPVTSQSTRAKGQSTLWSHVSKNQSSSKKVVVISDTDSE